ncbi:peptidyl-tRNA hydrolase [Cantharellus anzutake]|uniref:peptidyl-tRNA hydrolase n=1 Tax=Cantharellus anzutake TaxID=1750568 RepID=UPI0019077D9C|nr:peptidyl-tRNA hydrolase [Cantharellus anzutake]XP_038923644.1 peptidyl-tRNA hydrolase [Cantharellus anzutake]KAF8328656.1 peptidyl-tRNA hydrolase [Cantharellus anzutake]KAF8343756.1 peptidyl-tRNA hydrolase [Cantharellus anzutake]
MDTQESGSEDEEPLEGLSSVKAGIFEECKLVLVVRTDLGMTRGKIAAQCGHATLACYKTLLKSNPALLEHWERTGQAKIALRCDSEEELLLLQATAQSLNICANSIQDAGRTQIAAGSTTVLGIGPAPVKLINQVTGHLKLL